MKNKIGWCNLTWNPVWGCNNKCEYCYARGMAKRFWKQRYQEEIDYQYKLHPGWAWTGDNLSGLDVFKPTWLESKFQKKLPKKPQRIFVGSMSELYYWDKEWVEIVIEKIKQYPQHIFQFLTRYPDIYLRYNFPKNCWLGMTIADDKYYNYDDYQKFKISNPNNLKFVSFEPLIHEMGINLQNIDWVIIGAETGNRKGKIIPKKNWVEYIISCCRYHNVFVYLKDSLKEIYPIEIKEFPEVK